MLHDLFKKNCCLPIGVLASFLIPFRSVAQDLSPPISTPPLVAQVDSLMVGDVPFLDQDSGINLLDEAELVSPVEDYLNGLSPIASDSLVAQAIAETEEVISDSVPVTEVSQANGANPEDTMPVVPTETPVPDSEVPASPETTAVKESSQDADELIQRIRNSLVITGRSGRTITPALTVTTPIGFGGYYGSASIGVGYQSQSGPGEGTGDDAGAAVAISLGNPKDYVGFDLIWNIQGLSNTTNAPNNFGDGTLSLQALLLAVWKSV